MHTWLVRPSEPRSTIDEFTRCEQDALCRLRLCYQEGRDLFSARELARLRFVRWLLETGQLIP
jgi:hypothetical protein